MAPPEFHVFLSHNSKDKSSIRKLAVALRKRSIKVWLDEEELVPGENWQPAMAKAIVNSLAVAVCIGPSGIGPWEDEEMQGALTIAVREKRRVIPVILPSAPPEHPELSLFLTNRTWVDLRHGITDAGLTKLIWGIKGAKQNQQPSIDVSRKVLIEAALRCAVCGASVTLDEAPLVPCDASLAPTADNLLCLCANCRTKATSERWETNTLLKYKRSPWVHRELEAIPSRSADEPKLVEIRISLPFKDFDEDESRWLQYALAGFLHISPDNVTITDAFEGSTRVVVSLPKEAAERLLRAFERHDSGVSEFLFPLMAIDAKNAGEPSMTDLREGVESAWSQAFVLLWPTAFKSARGVTTDPRDAEEAAADALMHLTKRVDRVANFTELPAIVATFSKRRAINLLRKSSAAKRSSASEPISLDETIDSTSKPEGSPLKALEMTELLSELDRALSRLDPFTSRLLKEKYAEGYSYEELSNRHKIPIGTLCVRAMRGLRILKKSLSAEVMENFGEYLKRH